MKYINRKCFRCSNDYQLSALTVFARQCDICINAFAEDNTGLCCRCYHELHELNDKVFEDFINKRIGLHLYIVITERHNKEMVKVLEDNFCDLDSDDRHDCPWHSTCREDKHSCIRYHKCSI